jgi:hypothetical protein
MSAKFYASKSAAVRHAVNYIGGDWEKEYLVHEVELPDGGTYFAIVSRKHALAPMPTSRGSAVSERKTAVAPSFIPRSRIKGATRRVWDIADLMQGKARREVLEECRRQGIASGTAATQYQRWKQATRK